VTHAAEPTPDAAFFARDVVVAARELLGCTLVCRGTAGIIVETEAYHQREAACHAFKGHTARTEPLFGEPGTAYVYFTYGMHWCFNVVSQEAGEAAAVLVRAVHPTHGIDAMRVRREHARPLRERDLCSGPAKLVQAMGIDVGDNTVDVTLAGSGIDLARRADADAAVPGATVAEQVLAAEPAHPVVVRDDDLLERAGLARSKVLVGPRIGITVATDLPWRFGLAGSPHLSKRFA
jgi:DNA-3-methyladenine glycosylase